MTDQFVIYLGSSDSQNVHPANSNTDFIIDFPTQLLLDGEWEMALLEINRKNVYGFCDWCMESIMHEYLLPVLRKGDAEIQHILYMCDIWCMCDIFGVIMFGCSLMQPLSTRG